MNRRRFLRDAPVAGGLALAGCLERLGFEERSAWEGAPLVEDRPDAVYVPASEEEMGTYGTTTDGEYAVALTYTFPHRFWLVAGERERVDVDADDSLHLMVTVWDAETRTILPTDVSLDVRRDGESVRTVNPWAMLSQRMGFHYGDNVSLSDEGEYTARARVGPVGAIRRTGAFAGRFESAATLEVDFEYRRAAIHDLQLRRIEADRQGSRGALEPMPHGDGGHDEGQAGTVHPPTSRARPVEDLPGRHLGTASSADAAISVLETDADRLAGDASSYLAVCPRTPYNDVSLPFTALSATVERDGEAVADEPLRETLDGEFGHHYGVPVDGLEAGDEVTVTVDAPPQVARHDGYETAFFEFEPVSFEA
ncbi:DUF7350 domain-containing protein [Salinilacihabitans rarus]|uniref:DUF7350 domain-containing protein n=1 Tax=Salinilacihabitans rarus TaxID=2961596 RepID=UPI0020C83BCD|nr:hypothetical protein [Salinilacihabitans rarus]